MRVSVFLLALALVACNRPGGDRPVGDSVAADSVGSSRWRSALTHPVVALAPLADGGLAVLDASGRLTAFDGDGHPAPGPEVPGARALLRSGDRLVVVTAGGLVARPLTNSATVSPWTWATRSGTMGRPVVTGDGTIWVADGRDLVQLDPATGAELWRTALGDSLRAEPVVGEGSVYAATVGGVVMAMADGSGHSQWTTDLGEPVSVAPVVYGRDLFVGSNDHLTALSLLPGHTLSDAGGLQAQTLGARRWRLPIRTPVRPLAAASGLIYTVDGLGTLAAYRSEGGTAWRVGLGTESGPPTAPVVVGDRLYAGNLAGQLIGLATETGTVAWSRTLAAPITVRPVVSDDSTRLFVASGAVVHAVRLR